MLHLWAFNFTLYYFLSSVFLFALRFDLVILFEFNSSKWRLSNTSCRFSQASFIEPCQSNCIWLESLAIKSGAALLTRESIFFSKDLPAQDFLLVWETHWTPNNSDARDILYCCYCRLRNSFISLPLLGGKRYVIMSAESFEIFPSLNNGTKAK